MKAALYCRLSEEDRNKQNTNGDSESIQNQKSMLTEYAMDKGWEIYSIYSDDDYTGADRGRPAFNRLLKDAEQHKFDIVLCKTQSRFTRELALVEKYIHGLFPLWNIRFVSIVDNADTDNKGNKKARQINGLINEWYLEDMSDNIKSVLTNRRKNGFHIGSFALYGYMKDPNRKGHLIIDAEAAAVVQEVFALFAQGCGKTAIARTLNDRGIPNPTEYKRRKGLRYKPARTHSSTLWKYAAIDHMLANEIYIGNMVQGKYGSVSFKSKISKPKAKEQWIRVEGTHEPIIDRALWDRVQTLLQAKHRPFKHGQIGVFAKKAVCAHCGYTMRSSKNRGLYYLKCPTKHASKSACIGSFISVNTLEKAVLAELRKLVGEYLDMDKLERRVSLNSGLEARIAKGKEAVATCNKKLSDYRKGIGDLYLDKVKGLLSENEYVTLAADFQKEKSRLETLLSESRAQLERMENGAQSDMDKLHTIQQYLKFTKLDRPAVDLLIDHISISRRDPETEQLHATIHWSF